jgi:hypothetical protein
MTGKPEIETEVLPTEQYITSLCICSSGSAIFNQGAAALEVLTI